MRTVLRIPFKIVALPLMLALMLATAFLCFVQAIGETLLSFVAGVLALLGVATLIRSGGDPYLIRSGIAGLVFGFLLSPFGLPALTGLLIELLDSIASALQGFILR